jgi:signal transduction histidine kinase
MRSGHHGMRATRSVRVRVTLLTTVVVGLALGAGGFALVHAVQSRLESATRDRVEQLAEQAQMQLAGGMSPADVVQMVSNASYSGTFLQLYSPGMGVIGWNAQSPVAVPFAGRPNQLMVVGQAASPMQFDVRVIQSKNGPITAVAFAPLDDVRRSVSTLATALWFVIPALVVLVALASWFLVGRALRPVERLRREMLDISHSTLHRRIPEPGSGDEVDRLAHTMNEMLDRLESSAASQRRFVSDASHELRSPVATIRTTVEVASRQPDRADWMATARTVLDESERLDGLVADLLELARVSERVEPAVDRVDLDEIVLADAARLNALGYRVSTDALSAARVMGDARQLGRVVRNLLDNAVRYADFEVAAAVFAEGDEAVVRIDDDGPGVRPADRARIFERFARLDESRSRAAGGTGLGLPVVAAVVTSHGGHVAVHDSPLGGARFEVRLPLAEGKVVDTEARVLVVSP